MNMKKCMAKNEIYAVFKELEYASIFAIGFCPKLRKWTIFLAIWIVSIWMETISFCWHTHLHCVINEFGKEVKNYSIKQILHMNVTDKIIKFWFRQKRLNKTIWLSNTNPIVIHASKENFTFYRNLKRC